MAGVTFSRIHSASPPFIFTHTPPQIFIPTASSPANYFVQRVIPGRVLPSRTFSFLPARHTLLFGTSCLSLPAVLLPFLPFFLPATSFLSISFLRHHPPTPDCHRRLHFLFPAGSAISQGDKKSIDTHFRLYTNIFCNHESRPMTTAVMIPRGSASAFPI